MNRRIWALVMALLLPLAGAWAEETDEEVSIAGYLDHKSDTAQAAAADEQAAAEAAAAASVKQPTYAADGSVVLTMTFTGDVTIGSNMQSSSKSIFEKELDKQGGDVNFPFRNFKDMFEADDLTVVNFEGTLTTAGRNRNKLDNEFLFRAPPEYVSMLPSNGIEAVSLENNHVLDMGEDGLAETKQTLTSAGVTYASEDEPGIVELFGVKVGMLAYQTFDNQYPRLYEKVPKDIDELRAKGCQLVIVSYHWGAEKDYAPNDNQQTLAKLTIDCGADLVVGHHSHRINPIEEYNGHYICYSLGNFSFAGNSKPNDMSTFVFQTKFKVNLETGAAEPYGFIIVPSRISSRTDYNDFAPTPYAKQESITSVLNVLKKNGESLENPVSEYPLSWNADR
ncbi:MAG: CapA family protein [Eubacteriales bacterium]|nr:CapA family protein [Eubacteriales bacterium]